MKKYLEKIFARLPDSHDRYVVYFDNNKRYQQTWAEMSADIDHYIRILHAIRKEKGIQQLNVGIAGPVSYQWMLSDLACLKGGFRAVGLPEHFPAGDIQGLVNAESLDIVLADQVMAEKLEGISTSGVYYFNCHTPVVNNFHEVKVDDHTPVIANILDEFGIGYTSGTSQTPKRIKLVSVDTNDPQPNWLEKILTAIVLPFTFWSRSDNKVIIFMPFSHIQQRTLIKMALLNKINIILSNETNVIRHIITEKPNIMVAVPVIYEMIAARIRDKVSRFSPFKQSLYKLYRLLRVNRSNNWNPIKRAMDAILFNKIRKLYGGRASYFIVGSAKVDTRTVQTFFDIGVKILESYGQSETGIISMSSHRHFRIGSVGKPGPYVKIAPDGEILLKFNELYYHDHNRHVLTVNGENFIHTGDIGYLDKQGFLYLKGRKDEVIVLENGLKVYAAEVEMKLTTYPGIEHAVVFSDTGKKLKVIISATGGLSSKDVFDRIAAYNELANRHERITEAAVDHEPWNAISGHMTNTFKVKRNKIIADSSSYAFSPIIDRSITSFEN